MHEPLYLTDSGGDRATGYAMSNKIVRVGGRLLCTWLGADRVNRLAVVDPDRPEVLGIHEIGGVRRDNHCGAALALGSDGALHAVLGAHHGPLAYHRIEHPDARPQGVPRTAIDAQATYPSLVCDAAGTLHVGYRCRREDRWTLDYCRGEGSSFGDPVTLVRASKPGYIFWTNALALGPDGTLHLLFSQARPLPDGGFLHDVGHLRCSDGGTTWQGPDGRDVRTPLVAGEFPSALGGVLDGWPWTLPAPAVRDETPGPASINYQQILVSNPVPAADGGCWAVVHNGWTGRAWLGRFGGAGPHTVELTPRVRSLLPGHRVHVHSTLSRSPSGRLVAVLMAEPTARQFWGAPGTTLVAISADEELADLDAELLVEPEPGVANWLPALERCDASRPGEAPALLYTRGGNAGGFDANQNALRTDVRLRV